MNPQPSNELNKPSSPETGLADALANFNPGVDAVFVPGLERYCHLLWKWNQTHNLTRHTDFPTFVTRDLLDSVELSLEIGQGLHILDVGSGGGVPAIPLAILRSDLSIAMAESVAKKAAVLSDMVRQLSLKMPVFAERAEVVLQRQKFDLVTARAVAPLNKFLTWFQPCWKSVGHVLLIKGPRWVEEQEEAAEAGVLRRIRIEPIREWETPGRDGRSVILKITRH